MFTRRDSRDKGQTTPKEKPRHLSSSDSSENPPDFSSGDVEGRQVQGFESGLSGVLLKKVVGHYTD